MSYRPSVLATIGALIAVSVVLFGGLGWWILVNESSIMGTGNEQASPNGRFVASASTLWRESPARGVEERWYEFCIIRKETDQTVVKRRMDVGEHVPVVHFRRGGMILWAPDSSEVTFTDGTDPICTLVVRQAK